MYEQDAWNRVTTYLAENKIKKSLEVELQQKMVIGTIEKDVIEIVGEEPKEIMVDGQKLGLDRLSANVPVSTCEDSRSPYRSIFSHRCLSSILTEQIIYQTYKLGRLILIRTSPSVPTT